MPKKPIVSKVYFPQCLQCGTPFTARRPRHVMCSTECREKHTTEGRDYRAEYAHRYPSPRYCGCGGTLGPKRYKCDECVWLTKRARKARDKRRRRAAKLGVLSEPYTLAEIAERDGYRCGLCKRKVKMQRAVPHPHAPTIDHIVPLSFGGDDTRVNVQLACFLCNSVKGASGVQQLALIG